MTAPDSTEKSRVPWLLGVGAVLVWGVYMLVAIPRMDSGGLPEPILATSDASSPADYEWKLEDLEGKPVDFAAFRGKTVFLNIWATWCPPCVAEMPSIDRLAKNPRVDDVVFACVSGDESLAALRAFVLKRNLTVPVYRMLDRPPAAYETDGIPATFILTSDGKILLREVGAAEWDDSVVVQLLAGLAERAPRVAASD
jgi:thiol-disulfide isomerase/thioredoxin